MTSENGKSRGLRPDVLGVGGPRLLCPGLPLGREGIKKAGDPSGPRLLVRPEGGPAACWS